MNARYVGLGLMFLVCLGLDGASGLDGPFPTDAATGQPVRRNDEFVGLARAALANPAFTWRTLEGEGCRVHYQPGSFAARHVAALLCSAEQSIEKGLAFLGEKECRRSLDVFYINSREEMKQLVGSGVTGWADAESNSVYLVCNKDWRSFDQHEIMHVLSLNIWGNPRKPVEWIREGMAVYVDGRCGEYTVNELVHYLLQEDDLPPLDTLINHFYEQSDLNAYLQSGSLVGYIYERNGIDALKGLWEGGAAKLQDVLGMTMEELEAAWRSHVLGSIRGDSKVNWDSLKDIGCG